MRPSLGRNNFDFLRFVLASLVVLSHSYPLATGTEDREPLAVATGHQLTLGSLAVDCFFILSGFLITHSWCANPDVRHYFSKRVRRIYPGFVVAAVLGAFVIAPAYSTSALDPYTTEFVSSFTGRVVRLLEAVPGPSFQGNPAPNTVNGSLWSISYEFWCYVGVVICGFGGLLRRPTLLWAALAASIVLSLAFAILGLHPGGGFIGAIFGYPPFWARLLPFFIVGMAFYSVREQVRLNVWGAGAAVAAICIGALISNGLIVVLPVAAAYLLLWLGALPIRGLSSFARHGDLSYGVYLYSFPVLQMVAHYNGGKMEPLALFALAWPLSLVAAALSWFLVERWFVAGRRAAPRTALAAPPHA